MSRTATLPPIRIAPETKASLEAVLRDGESLTQFIENAVRREAAFRTEQNAAIARAKEALRCADSGSGLMTAEDFLSGMETRAMAAQQRIRGAMASRLKFRPLRHPLGDAKSLSCLVNLPLKHPICTYFCSH